MDIFMKDFELDMTILMYDDSVIDSYKIKLDNFKVDY